MKTDKQQLRVIFNQSLGIPMDMVTDDLAYNSLPQWDSTAHLQLVMALENHFEITLETDDMLDMSSVAKAAEILQKYGVEWT